MKYLSDSLISASITGFENPTLPFLEKTINLDELFISSPSSTHIIPSPNHIQSRGISKGDLLIVNARLTPTTGDIIYAVADGTYGVTTFERLASATTKHDHVFVVGVVQQSVHFFREAHNTSRSISLRDTNLHGLLVEKEHTTVLAKASGDSMLPYVHSGDLMLIERHLNMEEDDVCVIALNGDLVLKRVNRQKRLLSSDNPKYPPHRITNSDNISIEGVVVKIIKIFRSPCFA
ncbi:S24 family peptidase [Vibrio sp. D431a]|uniref:S24 family peptidase n=1 Tax=Vibrio sp. D431a TaxID=2837388 RepID=UPI00255297F2|nr:S24 family peptidase [Vibrio sp. D431a]MDK9790110.1 S24 family peptidase [Vibrio sp. D431a]